MTERFDYFVVFAEMRTGSNFLETNLNAFPSLTCLGEAFNPHFIGYPNRAEVLGLTRGERDADPQRLLRRIATASPGMAGFRYFHDHDPRVVSPILEDPRAAKIVLTRNPVDSYVSRKIAQATGQWKLTNVAGRAAASARFDAAEFERHLDAIQTFQVTLLKALQRTGQTAFHIAYEDLQDLEAINGLAAWFGLSERLDHLDTSLKRQNPQAIEAKVENFAEMEAALARLDRFNLSRTPNFEPRRGPMVPGYVAASATPLLFMPVRSGPETAVAEWLAELDGVSPKDLTGAFTQKTLRQWKTARPGHRSFTVLRHPLARAHAAFCAKILATGPGTFAAIRQMLKRRYDMDVPDDPLDAGYDAASHRKAFEAFLRFVKDNLNGQTAVRVDAHWASQTSLLEGMARFVIPDMVIRETEMADYLPALALQVGHDAPPEPRPDPECRPFRVSQILDDALAALARDVYARDYAMFGFKEIDRDAPRA